MALMRYEPWNLFNQLQSEVNRYFDPTAFKSANDHGNVVTSDWAPAVDIKEEDNRFIIHADIPGVDAKDIDVHMENGILTLRGERTIDSKDERKNYKRVERSHGTFYRRFSLPDTADADKITAKCANGVLEIVIPKHEKVQPKKISVES